MTEAPEGTPSTDSKTDTSIVDLSALGDLIDLDIGTGHPVVRFDLDSDTNVVDLSMEVSTVLGLDLLSNYVLVIETKDEFGRWERFNSDAYDVEGGVLRLTLIGGPAGQIQLADLPRGEYRAALVPDPSVLELNVLQTRTISVSATDIVRTEEVTVASPATGNYLDAATEGASAGLTVTSVTTGSGTVPVQAEGVTVIEGAFGQLVIDASGAYAYTPDITKGVGVDTFQVTVFDPATSSERTGELALGSQIGDGAPGAVVEAADLYEDAVLIPRPDWTEETHAESGTVYLGLLGLQVGDNPSFEFTVNEGTSVYVSVEASFASLLGVGQFGRVVIEKWNGSAWKTVDNTVDGGLLDLLGASGASVTGGTEFTEPGRYRVSAEARDLLSAGTSITLDGRVITFDLGEIGSYGAVAAVGNVVEASVHDSTTLVTEVNGEPVTAIVGKTVIHGQYGDLAIDVYGNYSYTPHHEGAAIGQVEAFTYTIRNAAGITSSGTLHVRVDSPDLGLGWPDWPDDPGRPAEVGLVAGDDAGTAHVDSAYLVTQGGPLASGSAPVAGGLGGATASVTGAFTINPNEVANVHIAADGPSTGSPTSSVTVTVTGDNGYSQVLNGTVSGARMAVSADLTLTSGSYTVVVEYVRTIGGVSSTLDLDVSATTVTHLDQFVAVGAEAISGNVLDDDQTVSPFVKFEVDRDGAFVEVASGTVVQGAYGVLTVNADGSYTYQVDQDLGVIGGVDSFTYRLVHPNGYVSEATLEITVEHGEGPYAPPEPFMMAASVDDDVVSLASLQSVDTTDDDADTDGGLDDTFDFIMPEENPDDLEVSLEGLPGGDADADAPAAAGAPEAAPAGDGGIGDGIAPPDCIPVVQDDDQNQLPLV